MCLLYNFYYSKMPNSYLEKELLMKSNLIANLVVFTVYFLIVNQQL